MVDSVYKKNENYYPRVFLEKYDFNKDVDIYSDNSYYVDSDEEYYHEKWRDFFLETIGKIWWIFFFFFFFNFFKLGTLKFLPEV